MSTLEINFVKHKSAKDIVISFFRFDHPRMKLENLLNKPTEFELKLGGETIKAGKVKDVLKVVRGLGVWGYCDKNTYGPERPEVHYWVGKRAKDTNIVSIMELFGHEIGHAIGYSDEEMAIKFGAVSALTYGSVMEEIYNKVIFK